MKVAIMQPYFFPYIGYFSLIKHTDLFILLDEVQFIRHGWIERNRILKEKNGWNYIKVPLKKHSQKTIIKDIVIDNSQNWKKKFFDQLIIYKKIAPFYAEVIKLLSSIFNSDFDNITNQNLHILNEISKYLEIKTEIKVFSDFNIEIEHVSEPDEWALNICKKIPNVTQYWNPEGGLTFFDKKKYLSNNIEIKFIKSNLTPYNQKSEFFESGLSIIDIMMFNDKKVINEILDNFELV